MQTHCKNIRAQLAYLLQELGMIPSRINCLRQCQYFDTRYVGGRAAYSTRDSGRILARALRRIVEDTVTSNYANPDGVMPAGKAIAASCHQ
jgi:hypothetical protein